MNEGWFYIAIWQLFVNSVTLFGSSFDVALSPSHLLIPFGAFFTIAFVINFLHWFLDTWTTSDKKLRIRFFNQAKTHHFYPFLVVKKDFLYRNDDAIYGSIFFSSLFVVLHRHLSFNVRYYVHCLSLATIISLEIHRYAHMPIKQVPYWIRQLQRSGFILSWESHHEHHNGEFCQSYDLMSDWMNIVVNTSGLYPALEALITRFTGQQPRTYLTDPKQKEELISYYKEHRLEDLQNQVQEVPEVQE